MVNPVVFLNPLVVVVVVVLSWMDRFSSCKKKKNHDNEG